MRDLNKFTPPFTPPNGCQITFIETVNPVLQKLEKAKIVNHVLQFLTKYRDIDSLQPA